MSNEYQKTMQLLYGIFDREKKSFLQPKEMDLAKSLRLIDEFLEIITQAFTKFGLQEDDEPNEFGDRCEDAISYLLNLRYPLANDIKK